MTASDAPLVSVLLAAHDAEAFLRDAVESVLAQTLRDLELVVVDDGSGDGTARLLESIEDSRLVVVRQEEQRGLAASLNHGLERARGRYVARLDADDVALPRRLERQVRRLREGPPAAVIGCAVLEIDAAGRPGRLHEMPEGSAGVRWRVLFGAPFFHPSVLLDRDALDQNGLRYDTGFAESEDYDLWARLLDVAEGDNLRDALLLYRVHPGQATQARRDLQRELQLRVALREIAKVAPGLDREDAELAWRVGAGEELPAERVEEALDAYLELFERFREWHRGESLAPVEGVAARAVARAGEGADSPVRAGALRRALELQPLLPLDVPVARAGRVRRTAAARREAQRDRVSRLRRRADTGIAPLRIAVVSPEPTPYGAPAFDRLARRADVDLTVIYVSRTLMWRTWSVEPAHRSIFLRGVRVPGARRLFHHDFSITPGIFGALQRERPDVVVVVGWSTVAAQGAVAWCRLRGVPYVLQVDSHDEGPRAGWRRAVKGAVVPRILLGASSVLATGTLVRRSMIARGLSPDRLRTFAVTIDVDAFARRAEELKAHREALRQELGIGPEDVAVLSVARLSQEKGLDALVRSVAAADAPRLVLVLAGQGPERDALEARARSLGVRLVLAGDRPWERIVEMYVAADAFALLSEREPWGVVVNEAAACSLPLLLSDRVGAAPDLLRDGENGFLVPAGDVAAAAAALRKLCDADLRARFGARSREIVSGWGYEPSVESFVEACFEAVAAR